MSVLCLVALVGCEAVESGEKPPGSRGAVERAVDALGRLIGQKQHAIMPKYTES